MHALMRSALALTTAFVLAAPAAAQIVGATRYEPVGVANPFLPDSRAPGPGIQAEVAGIRRDIRRARDGGQLTRREARRLDREARRIGAAAARYREAGLSASERDELSDRAAALRSRVVRAGGA